jgi:tRNA (cytidine32/uridine32-2'-O)-methyltransferase
LRGHHRIFATTARRGQKGLQTPREAAQLALQATAAGEQVAVVFGNEKTGLSVAEVDACELRIRIPMAADQPSINLAQSCQLIAYEWFLAGLEGFNVDR